jgi:membrane-bound inhibitor of C-type lysozyme
MMKNSFSSTRLLMAAYAALAVSACSSLDHLPFIGESSPAAPDQPKDATRYLCKGGSSFYVRMLGKENAVWLIFPDREVRFEKSATNSPGQYSNGSAVLEMNGSQASIKDEADSKYAECKVAGK